MLRIQLVFIIVIMTILFSFAPQKSFAASVGWKYQNSQWYYYHANGSTAKGWVLDQNTWYYLGSNGAMQTGWISDGSWYYLNKSGAMATGWVLDQGTWYYLKQSGAMATGWALDQGTWYYLNQSGAMATGWKYTGGKWYYLASSGNMKTGWVLADNSWYFMGNDGAMLTGWLVNNNQRYYLKSNGAMATGWLYDQGKWFYFDNSGAMRTGWIQVGTSSYYLNSDGTMKTGWHEESGITYFLKSDGAMATGELVIDGTTYNFSSSGASLSGPIFNYTSYDYTLQYMLSVQKGLNPPPQTDKYRYDRSFVSGEFLELDVKEQKKAVVKASTLYVREGPGTDSRRVGALKNGETIEIIAQDGGWYEIKYSPWKDATDKDILSYIDPNNFNRTDNSYFQFLKLSHKAGVHKDIINKRILFDKGILKDKADAFITASNNYNINEIYLISHALLETGNGMSTLANGVMVKSLNGVKVEPKKVYNMYGYGAKDACPIDCGAEFAYQQGWFSPEAAILGGAKLLGEQYINSPTYKQDTLYKMRWNPANPGKHQYATDMAWAVKQVNNIKKIYDLLEPGSYTLSFDVPVYK